MATLTPAANQNENLHIHKGKGVAGVRSDVPKPLKTGRQERKALRDLSQVGKPLPSVTKKGSTLKEKSAATDCKTVKKEPVTKILTDEETAKREEPVTETLTDEEIAQCKEWAKDGIEHMHFLGNDMHKFEARQQEERVRKKVDKVMSALRVWTDMMWSLDIGVEATPSDTEDVLKFEFEPEVLPPPRTYSSSETDLEDIEELLKFDFDSLCVDQRFDLKLADEYDSDTPCF